MMRITYTNMIFKSPELVFTWLAEPEKATKWQRNVKGVEIIVNKPEVIGTTFKEVIEEDGNSLEMRGVITKYIRNKIIGFHLESKIHKLDVNYSVEENNRNTRILVDAQINWKFPLNIMSIFIGKKMKQGIIKEMETEILELKRICETG